MFMDTLTEPWAVPFSSFTKSVDLGELIARLVDNGGTSREIRTIIGSGIFFGRLGKTARKLSSMEGKSRAILRARCCSKRDAIAEAVKFI